MMVGGEEQRQVLCGEEGEGVGPMMSLGLASSVACAARKFLFFSRKDCTAVHSQLAAVNHLLM